MLHDDEDEDQDSGTVETTDLLASMVPNKLDVPVDLMSYEELWNWIYQEILKEYWSKGGKLKHIKYGHTDFLASFWLEEKWP